ncbi:MAG: zinc-dependent alcohol dehydrogenase family protein [Tepidisphaeraceae bacterium]
MKAMLLGKIGPIEGNPLVEGEIPVPHCGKGEVRIKVEVCGICRTDLHVVEGDLPPLRPRVVPGHQVVGVVDKIGEGARRFTIGQRVGIAWLRWTCGECRYCLAGRENLCPRARFTGYQEDGGYAQYAVAPEDFAYALPGELDAASTAPLLCAGIIGFRALRQAQTKPGSRLGLYGFGSSAHIVIQVARHWGCSVYVMTRDRKHQQLALELGATWAGDAAQPAPEKVDSAILFAPVGDLVPAALQGLDMGGTLAIAGIHLSDIPSLNYEKHLFHEKTLCSVTANTRQDGEDLLKVAAEMKLVPKTTLFHLADANEALQHLKHDEINGSGVLRIPQGT